MRHVLDLTNVKESDESLSASRDDRERVMTESVKKMVVMRMMMMMVVTAVTTSGFL